MGRAQRWRKIAAGFCGLAAAIGVATLLLGQALRGAPPGDSGMTMRLQAAAAADPLSPPLQSLLAASQWLNSAPIAPQDLRGKVVLANFWTYSCINSLRTLPYLKAWAETYGDRGLVVIGVHTPEFRFERELGNVEQAAASLGIRYPVALDGEYAIWRSFANSAWPAFYFIGADGKMRRRMLGEGDYDGSERLIRTLLAEAGGAAAGPVGEVKGSGAEAEADWQDLRSPETYLGSDKADRFVLPGGLRKGPTLYRLPAKLPLNGWGLAGVWTIGGEFASADQEAAKIAFRFHARDLHMVLTPAAPTGSVGFRVTLDGAPPGREHGTDVDAEGYGRVEQPRMYQLIRQERPISDRSFEIEFSEPGVRAYVFTFG